MANLSRPAHVTVSALFRMLNEYFDWEDEVMRNLKLASIVIALNFAIGLAPAWSADEQKPAAAASARSCSSNSADRMQTCSVTCPEGKTATCVGGAQGAKDVSCTCK